MITDKLKIEITNLNDPRFSEPYFKESPICYLCNSPISYEEYQFQISNEYNMHICKSCNTFIENGGILTIPPNFSLQNPFDSLYAYQFKKNKKELYRVMMKIEIFIKYFNQDKKEKYDNYSNDKIYFIWGENLYDELVDQIRKEEKRNDFVKISEIKEYLNDKYKNSFTQKMSFNDSKYYFEPYFGQCQNCYKKIYNKYKNLTEYNKLLQKIENDESLDEIDKYGFKYEVTDSFKYDSKFYNYEDGIYFTFEDFFNPFNKKFSEISTVILHKDCIKNYREKHKIKPLHPIIFYDSI